jgi:hypothetical protein
MNRAQLEPCSVFLCNVKAENVNVSPLHINKLAIPLSDVRVARSISSAITHSTVAGATELICIFVG